MAAVEREGMSAALGPGPSFGEGKGKGKGRGKGKGGTPPGASPRGAGTANMGMMLQQHSELQMTYRKEQSRNKVCAGEMCGVGGPSLDETNRPTPPPLPHPPTPNSQIIVVWRRKCQSVHRKPTTGFPSFRVVLPCTHPQRLYVTDSFLSVLPVWAASWKALMIGHTV